MKQTKTVIDKFKADLLAVLKKHNVTLKAGSTFNGETWELERYISAHFHKNYDYDKNECIRQDFVADLGCNINN